jgi:hypothetical protein
LSSLEILEEIPCEFDDWEDLIKSDKWATRILKIWFTLIKNFSIVHKWAKWPEILNDNAFRPKAVKVIEDVIEELDSYLINSMKDAELENLNAETLLKLEVLIYHLGGPEFIDPHHELVDSSVCTFITFVLRDVMIYLGLMPSKETNYVNELKLCNAKQNLYADFYN